MQVDAIEADRVRLRSTVQGRELQPGARLHGGVLASLIDIAGTSAAWTGIDDRPVLETSTLDLSVNYLAAAIGE
mgnify:CR=1 FL=1